MEGQQTYSTSEAFKKVVEIVPIIWVVLLMIGCAVGPNYKRPLVNVPGEYRGKIPPGHCFLQRNLIGRGRAMVRDLRGSSG
jgi:hypothetical protein